MAKTYNLHDSDVADDQKTIEISETKQETRTEKKTVAQLKQEHQRKLDSISDIEKQADEIVDELKAIEKNIPEITIDNIPEKLVSRTKK